MKKYLLIAVICCISLFGISCNDENPTETNVVEEELLPTVPAPVGVWTAEELALISDYGEIEEVEDTDIPGTNNSDVHIEWGKPSNSCNGFGVCYVTVDIDIELDSSHIKIKAHGEYDPGGNLGVVRLDNGFPDNGTSGVTENGLLPIENYYEFSDELIAEINTAQGTNYSSCTLVPGLYLVDFTDSLFPNGVVYFNANIE